MRWLFLLLAGCKMDCTSLPDNRPKEVVFIPVRVVEPPDCKRQEELVDALYERIRYCEQY